MTATLRLAVCEAPADLPPGGAAWRALAKRVRAARADVALLNEMPFGLWIAAAERPDPAALLASRRAHEAGLALLEELGAGIVLGSRPAAENDKNVNQAFSWLRGSGELQTPHTKQFFPDEPGYYEARWFARGATRFGVAEAAGLRVGFLICTDVWFGEWARHYGRAGAHLIAVPRATPPESLETWKTGIKAAAIVSGCYVASSNRAGTDARGESFGGGGWIFDPDGRLLAETTADEPVAAAELDLALPARARLEYPRYVRELPENGET